MKRSTTYRSIAERVYISITYLLVFIGLLPFLWITFDLLRKGLPNLSFEFFAEVWPGSLEAVLASKSGEAILGGIANALAGSFQVVAIGLVPAFLIGVLTGVYLFEKGGTRFSKVLMEAVWLLYGTPSIIISIAIYLWIVVSFHNFSALAGGIALSITMLPIIVHYTQKTLKKESSSIKEAGIVLGGSNFRVLRQVLLASAARGIISGTLYAVSDAFGKVTPLLFTVLFASAINWNPLESSATLPILLWNNYELTYLSELLWPAILVLCLITFLFSFVARKIEKPHRRNSYHEQSPVS